MNLNLTDRKNIQKTVILFSTLALLVWPLYGEQGNILQAGEAVQAQQEPMPVFLLAALLFGFTFLLGLIAVAAGVGGGVLFVPIVAGFFPINIDFVRGAGLLVALSGALSAGPILLEKKMANLRLAIPMALAASTSAIYGARFGLHLSEQSIQLALGIAIIAIVFVILIAKKSEFPEVKKADYLSQLMEISGSYKDESSGKSHDWKTHRTFIGFLLFIGIGFFAGLFGLGAGWANVPVLNLVMGVPLKIAVATSVFILSITDTTAAWVYLIKGAIQPAIVIPSMAGMMFGTTFGVKILAKSKPEMIKKLVVVFLFLAGARALLRGLGY